MTPLARTLLAVFLMAATALAAPQPPAAQAAAPAQAPPDAVAAAEALPTATEILDRYVEALGGEAAIRRHRYATWTGKFSMPGQGLEGDLMLKASAPNLFRLDITAEGIGEISQGYDGKVGWGDNMMTGPTLMKDGELELLAIQSDFYVDLNYAKHYPTIEVVERATFDGEPCWKVALRTAGGLETFSYFSTVSGLLVGNEGDLPTSMGDVFVKVSIGGYREFDGRLYPTENRQEVMGTQQVITLHEPDFTEIDPSVFELPPAIRTLADGARPETPAGAQQPR